SVRRVTQQNAGRKSAGVDGMVVVTAPGRVELACRVHRTLSAWQARPVKRVYISKASGGRRPLGIPLLVDRVHQARVKNALEPEWEARFEPKSYGFRPGRGCHDAIEAIYWTLNGKHIKRQWILDADLRAAFDHIDQDHLLHQLAGFPARGLVEQWLKAGVVEKEMMIATEEGTPQGGVISPVLSNIALHGLEEAAGVRYHKLSNDAAQTVEGCPVLVRYADDLLAICHSRQQAEQVKARLAEWLEPRGLSFNEDKTRIVHLNEGVDFLGFNIRRYPNGKLLIKPSKTAVRRFRQRLSSEMHSLNEANALAIIRKINRIVRGWVTCYRGVVSKDVFATVDHHLWRLAYKWALRTHSNKPKRWVTARYFGQFNQSRADRWVFGDRDSGAYLVRAAWTKIVRHQMVKGLSSKDDPTLDHYWAERRRRQPPPPLDKPTLDLLKAQGGRCRVCEGLLLYADGQPQSQQEWEQWLRATRKAVKKHHLGYQEANGNDDDQLRLVHAYCQRRLTAGHARKDTLLSA
ncbi:MAG: group II intron reverse transcriptase/maturase, partial [Mycobacteriales bacterium]